MFKRTAIAASLLLALTGCMENPMGGASDNKTTPEKNVQVAEPATQTLAENVVAKVNGVDVAGARGMKNLDDVIIMEVMAQAAQKGGLSEESLQSISANVEHIERQMLMEAFADQFVSKQTVSEADARQYYEQWVESQDVNEYRFRFARFDDGNKASEIIADINSDKKADLSDFKYLKSAESDQDRIWSSASDLPPMFASILPSLSEQGTHSEPLASNQGYFVIYLEEKRKKDLPEFAEAQEEVEQAIKQEALMTFIKDTRKEAIIQIK